ncbi:MAG: phosphate acyltransferase [Prevotella sp.]|nr:phosphate acyltransferase [Prevotella sp.]
MKNFIELVEHLKARKVCRRVAVVNPKDKATLEAVKLATSEGFIEPIMIEDNDLTDAAGKAVIMAQEGQVDMIMKGLIPSETLLKAVIRYNGGLLPNGGLLSQIGCVQIPSHHKLLLYTDAVVIPFPTHEQRIQQVRYIAKLGRAIGIEEPRISLIHCSEDIDVRHFPYTGGYPEIIQMGKDGAFGRCIIGGPLDVRSSCSLESMQTKGIDSPIVGEADALVFPDIESANTFHKTVALFANAKIGSILQGSKVPVMVPSRADSAENKYYSLALASALGSGID